MLSNQEAARILGVAEWEVLDTRLDDTGWSALVHDSASHEDTWRIVQRYAAGGVIHSGGRYLIRGEHGPEEFVPLADIAEKNRADLKELAEEFDQKADDAVPEGTAAEVLAWVGDDPERAGAALVAESTRDKPRSTLIAALEKLTG